MKSRFTYIGESVIEVVVDGDSLTWNVLQDAAAAPVAPPLEALPLEAPPEPVAAPLMLAPTKKKRTLMGFIRAGWFYIFTALGGVLDYLIQRYTELPVPTGTATVIGGALYGLKRALYPNTTL